MQILGLLGMYFDAVVVKVDTFIQICSCHTVNEGAFTNHDDKTKQVGYWKCQLYADFPLCQ